MKKLLLAAFVFATAAFSAKAQQGSVLVFGNLGFQTQSEHYMSLDPTGEGSTALKTKSSFSIAPGVGYQFNKNWTAGVELGFSSSKFFNLDENYNVFKAGAFARYTYPLSNIFSIYGQGGVGYQGAKYGDSKASGVYAYAEPVVAINVKNGFALNFDFGGIGFDNVKPKDGDGGSAFGLTFGKTMSIGISKNFGGKK